MAPGPRSRDGEAAESLAARHLESHGVSIVARNVRSRHGEIDLVARDGAVLVFVEVRLRRPGGFGGGAASVTAAKRARLVAAASEYLARQPRTPACRFDVVVLDELDAARIEWLKDAFGEAD